jgi:aspartate/methionine/tyrosine aminotransferase
MLNEKLGLLNDHPFARLAELIRDVTPKANIPPLAMSIGDPQDQPPAFAAQIVAQHAYKWNSYPAINGTLELRAAIKGWLDRRYGLAPDVIDVETQIAPVAGTREGLFIVALLAVNRTKNGEAPIALMPNPFYQIYFAAAAMAGAQPVYLTATEKTGFLPDLDAIPEDTLRRTSIFYLCSPGNPQGAIASLDYLKKALSLARRHDFLLVMDECYAELYYGKTKPPGGLQAALALGPGAGGHVLDNLVCFHTLSKRSSAAGYRSGFGVGAPATMKALNRLRSFSCAATPLPIQAASAALWNEEDHAVQTRATYAKRFEIAKRHLAGLPGFRAPEAGMFLWLDVGDGEETTRKLWRDAAIKVLPGAYLTKPEPDGSNSGRRYIRVALIHDFETCDAALARMAQALR